MEFKSKCEVQTDLLKVLKYVLHIYRVEVQLKVNYLLT